MVERTSTGTMKDSVVVSGLPGKMATEVARKIIASTDFLLYSCALTGSETGEKILSIDNNRILLYVPNGRSDFIADCSGHEKLVVDFSHPSAVNGNVDFYCDNRFNFVMGTTGGDRLHLKQE